MRASGATIKQDRPSQQLIEKASECEISQSESPATQLHTQQQCAIQNGQKQARLQAIPPKSNGSPNGLENSIVASSNQGELQGIGGTVSAENSIANNSNNVNGNTASTSGSNAPSRSKRLRTSFKHNQLKEMKRWFSKNQNPDAKDLKILAETTGLSKRVLQVSDPKSFHND